MTDINESDMRLSATITYQQTLLEYVFAMLAQQTATPIQTTEAMRGVMERVVAKTWSGDRPDEETEAIRAIMGDLNRRFFAEVEHRVRTAPGRPHQPR